MRMPSENHAQLVVVYDGRELHPGVLPARDVATMLWGTAGLCERANALLNADRATVDVRIHGEPRSGSFEVLLDIWQSVPQDTQALVADYAIQSAHELLRHLGLVAAAADDGAIVGLLELLRRLRGQRPRSVERRDDGVVVVHGDGNTINVTNYTMNLYGDSALRSDFERVAQPLRGVRVERVEFRDPQTGSVAGGLTRDEVPYLTGTAGDTETEEVLADSTVERAAQIVTPQFAPGLRWRFAQGDSRFTATLEDPEFWTRVEEGHEAFQKGDILRFRLRTRDIRTADGVRSESAIVEVLEHIRRPTQRSLFPE